MSSFLSHYLSNSCVKPTFHLICIYFLSNIIIRNLPPWKITIHKQLSLEQIEEYHLLINLMNSREWITQETTKVCGKIQRMNSYNLGDIYASRIRHVWWSLIGWPLITGPHSHPRLKLLHTMTVGTATSHPRLAPPYHDSGHSHPRLAPPPS